MAAENRNRIKPGWLRSRMDHFRKSLQHKEGTERPHEDPMGADGIRMKDDNYGDPESRDRGRNFAEQFGQLNLYRRGLSKKLIGALHQFDMSDLDRIWTVSYLMAAMKETVDGIQYDTRNLELKAQDVFDSHMNSFEWGASEACEAIEDAFIVMHGKMAKKIDKSREEAGLPSLNENALQEDTTTEEYIRHVTEEDPELASYLCVNKTVSRGEDGVIRGVLEIDSAYRRIPFIAENGRILLIDQSGHPNKDATLRMIAGDFGEEWRAAIMPLMTAYNPPGPNDSFDFWFKKSADSNP